MQQTINRTDNTYNQLNIQQYQNSVFIHITFPACFFFDFCNQQGNPYELKPLIHLSHRNVTCHIGFSLRMAEFYRNISEGLYTPLQYGSYICIYSIFYSMAMYVWRNTKAPSCNNCSCGKAIRITCRMCVFVALGVTNAMRMRHIVICGLPCSTVFCRIIS